MDDAGELKLYYRNEGSPKRMNTIKETERAELHKTIWRIANDLRGSVDGWDFKTSVLGMLFYRFISENLTSYLNDQERRAGLSDFDYAQLKDSKAKLGRAKTVQEKGFYILPSRIDEADVFIRWLKQCNCFLQPGIH
ncbi:MAG: hypothetical protein A2004_07735 [Spirochaetes bacterium GWC1_61_12]|nr:MAG: hypothetical protein A2004_07735 [Spirochaetes bacterium GWC1_61_12]